MIRRQFLGAVATAGTLLLAGCNEQNRDEEAGFGDGEGVKNILTLEDGTYSNMDLSADGRSILTATTEEILLHGPSGESDQIADGIINPNLAIAEDGGHILTTQHGTATVYDVEGEVIWERIWQNAQGSETEIADVGTANDFQSVTFGSLNGLATISIDGDVLWEATIPAGRIWEIDSSESGGFVVARTEERDDPNYENGIHVVEDGEHIWSKSYEVPPLHVGISDSAEIVAVGLDDGRLLVYDLSGELQWENPDLGGFFSMSDDGELILTHHVENTVAFNPTGEELWRDSEVGLWWYNLTNVSNDGRSIAAYEDPTENTYVVKVYSDVGDVVWEETYEGQNLEVKISADGTTWLVNKQQEIEFHHDHSH